MKIQAMKNEGVWKDNSAENVKQTELSIRAISVIHV